ncbi:hypothetical protein VKT23_019544 [Stygiomarasmius scandens]|uniref:Uncharacterized protein n=1 Tax=Marasmiellus scandens TaxID=2682957 RepID=A0ABR1IL68_9AGAR
MTRHRVDYTPLQTTSDPIKLVIQGNSTGYKLGFAEGDGPVTFTADVDSAALSIAPAGGVIRHLQHWEREANTGSSIFCLLEADACYA